MLSVADPGFPRWGTGGNQLGEGTPTSDVDAFWQKRMQK